MRSFTLPTQHRILEGHERHDDGVDVIGFAVDGIVGQDADGAVGLLGVVAPEDLVIRVPQLQARPHQLGDFARQVEDGGLA